jgi:hypothetical protein
MSESSRFAVGLVIWNALKVSRLMFLCESNPEHNVIADVDRRKSPRPHIKGPGFVYFCRIRNQSNITPRFHASSSSLSRFLFHSRLS